jgi:hypothetical protein
LLKFENSFSDPKQLIFFATGGMHEVDATITGEKERALTKT